MQAEMALKEAEAERQRTRIKELEAMQQRLEEALQQEIKARQDEEAFRYAQARWAAAHKHIYRLLGSLFAFLLNVLGCVSQNKVLTLISTIHRGNIMF